MGYTAFLGRNLVRATRRPPVERYLLALTFTLLAFVLTSMATETARAPFFTMFTAAVVLSSIIGGTGSGLAAAIASAVLNLLFRPPSWSIHLASPDDAVRIALFTLVSCGIATLIGAIGELQKRLEAERSKLHITLQSIGDAVIATDADGNITLMNPVAEELTGWPIADAKGVHFDTVFRLLNERTRAVLESPLKRVLEEGRAMVLENSTLLVRMDDTEIPIDDSAAPIRDGAGKTVGAVFVFRDITTARMNEFALRQADRLAVTGKLASTIAHEMNNPLEAVVNLLYLASEDQSLSHSTRSYVDLAQSQLGLAIECSRRTLSLRQVGNNLAEVTLRDLVDSVVDLYRNSAKTREVQIVNEISPALVLALVPSEIRQMVSNLVLNALDAMPCGGMLKFTTAAGETPDSVRLLISDTGSGIDPKNLDRIFEPFFTTKQDVGTGLGLWVARRIAEDHGGKLEATSSASGSIFTATLPVKAAPRAAVAIGRRPDDLVADATAPEVHSN